MDIDRSRSRSRSHKSLSPMDIDSKSRSRTASRHSPMTVVKALEQYMHICDHAFRDMKPSISRKEVLLTFHPDKMPVALKEFAKTNTKFDHFINHMFSDLHNRKSPITRAQIVSILKSHTKDDLDLQPRI